MRLEVKILLRKSEVLFSERNVVFTELDIVFLGGIDCLLKVFIVGNDGTIHHCGIFGSFSSE